MVVIVYRCTKKFSTGNIISSKQSALYGCCAGAVQCAFNRSHSLYAVSIMFPDFPRSSRNATHRASTWKTAFTRDTRTAHIRREEVLVVWWCTRIYPGQVSTIISVPLSNETRLFLRHTKNCNFWCFLRYKPIMRLFTYLPLIRIDWNFTMDSDNWFNFRHYCLEFETLLSTFTLSTL